MHLILTATLLGSCSILVPILQMKLRKMRLSEVPRSRDQDHPTGLCFQHLPSQSVHCVMLKALAGIKPPYFSLSSSLLNHTQYFCFYFFNKIWKQNQVKKNTYRERNRVVQRNSSLGKLWKHLFMLKDFRQKCKCF